MTHLTFDHYPTRHPGHTTAGNVGFYTVLGLGAVCVALLIAVIVLATGALQGLAAIVSAAV